jgi:hypothetical protein
MRDRGADDNLMCFPSVGRDRFRSSLKEPSQNNIALLVVGLRVKEPPPVASLGAQD